MALQLPEPTEAVDGQKARSEWQRHLRALAKDVRSWSEERGWKVDEATQQLEEEKIGAYRAPRLVIHVPRQDVILEPVARFVQQAEGRVDLYSYPSMDRVMLLRSGQEWVIYPELGPRWPLPWNRGTFLDLAERLAGEP